MSGSIGGKRIKREEVQPTLDKYISQVLSKVPGFVSAEITGSYNAGTRKDHGDIDLAVHIKGTNVAQVKKEFKAQLDTMDLPEFVFGKNQGKKSQMYGAIVTCGFPIAGREEDYVQIDNIIVTNENEQKFQRKFLDLDAAKQGLIMGVMRVILHYKNADKILNEIGLVDLPKPSGNQEYEFVLSSAGLSFRLVTLNSEMKEVAREELWRSANWDLVEYILNPLDLTKSYEELLNQIAKMVKNDNRSKRRIVGIMKSMIRVGPGEVGTPKGDSKIAAIERAETMLKENQYIPNLYTFVMENSIIGENDPRKQVGAICREYDYYDRWDYISGFYTKFAHIGKNVWFKDADGLIKFLNDNWNEFKGWFASDKNIMQDIVTKAYETCVTISYKTVPFVLAFGGKLSKIWVRRDYHANDEVHKIIADALNGQRYNKWEDATGFGDRDSSGRLFEKKIREYLNTIARDGNPEITPVELKNGINRVLGSILRDIIEELKGIIDDETSAEEVNKMLKKYITPGGRKASRRKLFNNGFKFDMDNLMQYSGQQIADITLKGRDGKFYYISLKNGVSQSSGPQINEMGKALKDGDTNNKLLKSFCEDALHINTSTLCDWYADPSQTTIKICQNGDCKELVNLIKLIIGGGYIYVNSNGDVFEVPADYDLKGLSFDSISKAHSRGDDLKTLYINGSFGSEPFRLIWRASNGESYPVRFILEYDKCMMIYNNIIERVE